MGAAFCTPQSVRRNSYIGLESNVVSVALAVIPAQAGIQRLCC
jgi:hypothetical protein